LISKITQFRWGNLAKGNNASTVRVATVKPPDGQGTKRGFAESRRAIGTKEPANK